MQPRTKCLLGSIVCGASLLAAAPALALGMRGTTVWAILACVWMGVVEWTTGRWLLFKPVGAIHQSFKTERLSGFPLFAQRMAFAFMAVWLACLVLSLVLSE
jgi:hypothetical protein